MAVQQGKGKMSFGQIIKKHSGDEVDYGNNMAELPPGISGGIAKLVDIKLGQYKTGANQGQNFVYARGVVITPKEHTFREETFENGKVVLLPTRTETVAGRNTSIMLPMCETTKADKSVVSMEDNVTRMMNEVKKLAGPDCFDGIESEEDLTSLFEAMKEANRDTPIYFKFSTFGSKPSQAYPKQTTFHNWFGTRDVPEGFSPDTSEEVVDNSGEEESEAPPPPATKKTPSQPASKPAAKKKEAHVEAPAEDPIDALLARCQDDDDDAKDEMKSKYLELGYTEEDYEAVGTWDELAELIKSGELKEAGDSEDGGSGGDDWQPAKEDVYKYNYRPADPKTGKPGKKTVEEEIEVVSVDVKNQTVKAKSLNDPKRTYTVKWDELGRD